MIRWWKVLREGLEFIRALLAALKTEDKQSVSGTQQPKPKPLTTNEQIAHQRELHKKNHPKG